MSKPDVSTYREERKCPYCGQEDDLEFDSTDYFDNSCYQEVWCKACGKQWQDIYRLVGILTDDDAIYLSETHAVID